MVFGFVGRRPAKKAKDPFLMHKDVGMIASCRDPFPTRLSAPTGDRRPYEARALAEIETNLV
jgi:hypothetical protein